MKTAHITLLVACLAAGLAAAVYWPGMQGGFFFDDRSSILQAEGVRLESLTVDSLRQALASGHAGPSGRPISQLSFALNHYFSGFDPFAFKTTNLAIHAACGLLVFFLALRLLAAIPPQAKRRNTLIAAGVLATAWLLHPIQLLPVLHVVQRMTSLSALFLLAALLLHVSGRERGGRTGTVELLLAWGVLWPLSFFSKETGALFPGFVLAWELIVRRLNNGGLDRFARMLAVMAGLTLAAVVAYMLSPAGQWLWSAGYDLRAFTLGERLLTEGRVLWFYVGLILLPRLEALGLYHDDIPLSTGLLEPWTTLPALAGLACLVWLTWWLRRRAPLVSFGIAWFLIGHGLESTFLPLEIAHEHRNYLPLFGILLGGAWALTRALEANGPRKTLGIALAAVALTYFSFVTALRAHQFGEERRRTQIEAQHHRTSARAQHEAGRILAGGEDAALANSPTYSFARAHYEIATRLDPTAKISWLGLIHLNCKAGKTVEREWVEALTRRLRETSFAPGDRNLLYDLKEMSIDGALCLERADIELLFASARANPTVAAPVRAMLHSWLADYLWLGARDLSAAEAELERSLAIAPYNPSNRLKRAQLAFLQRQYDETIKLLAGLDRAFLSSSEMETLAVLKTCLAEKDPSARCVGK